MVPMNEQYLVEEAAFVLERTEASCAVVEPKFLGLYRAVRDSGPYCPKGVLVARTHDDKVEGVEEARAALERDGSLRDFSRLRAEAAAELDEVRPLSADDPAEIDPSLKKPISMSSTPAMTVAATRPSMPSVATMPATMVANAAVGPEICTRLPPRNAMRNPATMAV